MNRTITFDRFKELCFGCNWIEIGDNRILSHTIAEENVTFEIEPDAPGLVTEIVFNRSCFPAEADEGDVVIVNDVEGEYNEVRFYVEQQLRP